jgi:hypothetical protein
MDSMKLLRGFEKIYLCRNKGKHHEFEKILQKGQGVRIPQEAIDSAKTNLRRAIRTIRKRDEAHSGGVTHFFLE